MPQPAQGPYGVAVNGPILWSTGTRDVSAYRYTGVFTAGASGEVPLTPLIQVARGLVTATVTASAGTGTNIMRIYQNGTLRSSVTISSTGTPFSTSFTASDGDQIQVIDTNAVGSGMTVSVGSLTFVRSPLRQFGRSVSKLGAFTVIPATYPIPAALVVALSPPFVVARGQVYCRIVVTSGTGTNSLILLRNGSIVVTNPVGGPGTELLAFDADDNDLIQLFSSNTLGTTITIAAGSTIQFVRSRG